MDHFIFKTGNAATPEIVSVPDVAGESQRMVWGTDGVSVRFEGMHVDPVIPGTDQVEDSLFWV